MQIDIIEKVLEKLNYIMTLENRIVLLILDNAPVHPENLVGKYSNIKIAFLPKNTTSRLWPLDADIIKNCKVKHQKKLLRHTIARISNDRSASDIAKEVDILQAITWVAAAWKEVSETTIKNCFAKCDIVQQVVENDECELDDEFGELFKELTEMNEAENGFTAEEYIDFDNEISRFHPPINSEMVDWKAASIQAGFNEYANKEQRIELDSEDHEEPDDIEDEQESFQVTPREALAMIYRLVHTSGISNDDQNGLFGIKENLERIVIMQKSKKTLFLMYFTDGTLSSCTEISLTSLKDIKLCFQNKAIFSSFCILCFYVL